MNGRLYAFLLCVRFFFFFYKATDSRNRRTTNVMSVDDVMTELVAVVDLLFYVLLWC